MIVTVQQHILQEQEFLPESHGTLPWLMSGITLATKMVQSKIRRAGLLDILGTAGDVNVQGETQQKLDVYANQALLHCLGVRDSVAMLVSEENDEPVTFNRAPETGRYIIVFDPLDGSSNIDVNVNVGTIFSILRRAENEDLEKAVLQPGYRQVAAGYVLYGPSTVMVYTAGHGVHGFTLDPAVGAYVLSTESMKMPEKGTIYSTNEANAEKFPECYRDYLKKLRAGAFGRSYTSRYIGSLVADFHRSLLKGGIFLYPPTDSHKAGKLRLLYEANPLAFIAEQAGGVAVDGERRILDIVPDNVHQRTPLIVGSKQDMDEFSQCILGAATVR